MHEKFVQENDGITSCAVCDETTFYTTSGENGEIRTDLEHYFPKDIYPHLSCHPYNLVPICPTCNRFVHGDNDPLRREKTQQRRTLAEVFLPFQDESVSTGGVVKVVWDAVHAAPSGFEIVWPAQTSNVTQKIKAFSEIYDIPGRWNRRLDVSGDHLWRRMHQMLADDLMIGDVIDSSEYVQRKLERMLYFLSDDLGRDPLALPSMWWLVNLLVDEIDSSQSADSNEPSSAFWEDVRQWIQVDEQQMSAIRERSESLRLRLSPQTS